VNIVMKSAAPRTLGKMTILLKNFRIVDETMDMPGSLLIEHGIVRELWNDGGAVPSGTGPLLEINGGGRVLMPAFVDLHAHFREPGYSEKETLESASMAAAAGGYGTAVCMANTRPPIDSIAGAAALRERCNSLGLIDLFPVMSLTKNMEGRELSEITKLNTAPFIRMISEDGKDLPDENLFLEAFAASRRAGIPVSCHCDLDGEDAATERALRLAAQADAHVHIAHVSTKKSIELIGRFKTQKILSRLSCEVTPHHLALTEKDAAALGADSVGKAAPPLRSEEDREALIAALAGGAVDAIATDHAPHTRADKAGGLPGFSGLETAFAVCYSFLVKPGIISLSKLSSLMSAAPARILALGETSAAPRGLAAPGYRADFCAADIHASWTVDPEAFKSRGKNSPFAGRTLSGKILMTLHGGRIVYDGGNCGLEYV
jgi:dihydroorotase